MKEKVIVSACLVGVNCKYNGKNNFNEKVSEYLKDKDVILVCPEVMGGLSTPRLKSEILKDKVINELGDDVTSFFVNGAKKALDEALKNDVKVAILKQRSPSCGSKQIYNGKFNGTVVDGSGVFARMLKEHDIKVLSEEAFK